MEQKSCLKCGYKWRPRVDVPVACPNCKRYDWKEIEGRKKNETKNNT